MTLSHETFAVRMSNDEPGCSPTTSSWRSEPLTLRRPISLCSVAWLHVGRTLASRLSQFRIHDPSSTSERLTIRCFSAHNAGAGLSLSFSGNPQTSTVVNNTFDYLGGAAGACD